MSGHRGRALPVYTALPSNLLGAHPALPPPLLCPTQNWGLGEIGEDEHKRSTTYYWHYFLLIFLFKTVRIFGRIR